MNDNSPDPLLVRVKLKKPNSQAFNNTFFLAQDLDEAVKESKRIFSEFARANPGVDTSENSASFHILTGVLIDHRTVVGEIGQTQKVLTL